MSEDPPLLATHPREVERRDSLRAARCVQLPVTSVEPVTGPSPELVAALALHRAHGGGVVKLDADYLDHGLPAPGGC